MCWPASDQQLPEERAGGRVFTCRPFCVAPIRLAARRIAYECCCGAVGSLWAGMNGTDAEAPWVICCRRSSVGLMPPTFCRIGWRRPPASIRATWWRVWAYPAVVGGRVLHNWTCALLAATASPARSIKLEAHGGAERWNGLGSWTRATIADPPRLSPLRSGSPHHARCICAHVVRVSGTCANG